MRILVLEDELELSQQIRAALAVEPGWKPEFCRNGDEALERALREPFDCLVFDRMVDGMDGVNVLEKLRSRGVETPALLLSRLGSTAHRVDGLERGADDYLAKPFHDDELVARVRALIRRAAKIAHPVILTYGPLELHTKAQKGYWKGRDLELPPKELGVLLCLLEHSPDVVSPEMLWRRVWAEMKNLGPQQTVIQTTLSRLRTNLRNGTGIDDVIVNERGKGYRLNSREMLGGA
jgi:two-component system, OmpR family, response regulator